MAEIAAVTGFYALEDLLNTSVAERTRRYCLRLTHKGAWGRCMRRISDSRASRQQSQLMKQPNFQEVGICGTAGANRALQGMGELLRTRRGAANLSSATTPEVKTAGPPHTPCVAPNLREAPLHRRANDAEKNRQRRNAVNTAFLNTVQPALN